MQERIEGARQIRAGTQHKEAIGNLKGLEDAQKEAEYDRKLSDEIPEVVRAQLVLIQELREVGITGAIEEVTGEEFPGLDTSHKPFRRGATIFYGPSGDANWEKEWRISLPFPNMNRDGVWDTNVRIQVEKFDGEPPERRGALRNPPISEINVIYTKDREITISGAHKEFIGSLAVGPEVLKSCLAYAFADPKPSSQLPRIELLDPNYRGR